MAENKFIERLQGKSTEKSVVEIKNTTTPTMFTNMPAGDSNAFNTYSDHRGNATVVANGTLNWKLNGSALVDAPTIHGDGNDFISSFKVFGNGLWIDSSYTFTESKIFTPNTKWVLKLCGSGLTSVLEDSVELILLIKFGTSTLISKTFLVGEHSFSFSEELVIDFSESEQSVIKVSAGDTMSVQVLCGDATAEATIYNGMTVFTALQRRVDADTVASDTKTFTEVVQDIDDINDEIDQIHEDVETIQDDIVEIQGDIEDINNKIIVRSAIMPTPSADLVGKNYQYAGTTNAQYTHNYIYECVAEGSTYSWVRVNVQPDYTAEIQELETDVDNIQAVIPEQATPTNQLVTQDTTTLMQQQINHLQTIGRFLSFWDATTGLAQTNPQTSPYIYKTGDYFRIGVVAGPGGTNYKPSGSSYTTGVASTVVETERLSVGQVYYYDGANWALAAGGSVAIDETTIVFDSDDKIQAVATVNQNPATGATNPVYDWVGTLAEYQAQNIETLHPDWICYIIDDISSGGLFYNIGDTFMTKRTDTNLAGAVECDGATYNTTDFTGSGSIGELLEAGKLDYVSLSAYSTAISTKGWCDKIGWNGAGTTSFRVPTLTPRIIQTNNISVVGNGMTLGLTNGNLNTGIGTGWNGNGFTIQVPNSYGEPIGYTDPSGAATDGKSLGVTTDPTKSGIIADTSDTAQLRVMIQIANGATDQALETCTGVLADVAGLKDMSNITATGKETVVGWGLPDYTAGVQITTTAQTATKNGWLIGSLWFSGSNVYFAIDVDGIEIIHSPWATINAWGVLNASIPLKAGQTYRYYGNGTMERNHLYFYPNNE